MQSIKVDFYLSDGHILANVQLDQAVVQELLESVELTKDAISFADSGGAKYRFKPGSLIAMKVYPDAHGGLRRE